MQQPAEKIAILPPPPFVTNVKDRGVWPDHFRHDRRNLYPHSVTHSRFWFFCCESVELRIKIEPSLVELNKLSTFCEGLANKLLLLKIKFDKNFIAFPINKKINENFTIKLYYSNWNTSTATHLTKELFSS